MWFVWRSGSGRNCKAVGLNYKWVILMVSPSSFVAFLRKSPGDHQDLTTNFIPKGACCQSEAWCFGHIRLMTLQDNTTSNDLRLRKNLFSNFIARSRPHVNQAAFMFGINCAINVLFERQLIYNQAGTTWKFSKKINLWCFHVRLSHIWICLCLAIFNSNENGKFNLNNIILNILWFF